MGAATLPPQPGRCPAAGRTFYGVGALSHRSEKWRKELTLLGNIRGIQVEVGTGGGDKLQKLVGSVEHRFSELRLGGRNACTEQAGEVGGLGWRAGQLPRELTGSSELGEGRAWGIAM